MQLYFWAYNDAGRAEDMDLWADEAIVPTSMSPKYISNQTRGLTHSTD